MRVLLLSVGLLVAGPAFANDNVEILIPEVTELDFEEVDVNGTVQRPSVIMVSEKNRRRITPFIRLRQNFSSEIRASLHSF
jgi:hypothetical protein